LFVIHLFVCTYKFYSKFVAGPIQRFSSCYLSTTSSNQIPCQSPLSTSKPGKGFCVLTLMLTLGPGSICDVCAEEYSPQCIPHSIPCGESSPSTTRRRKNSHLHPGHVLCSSCCHKIVEKTLPRLQPVCPFCREHFSGDDVRLIRIDFSAASRRRGGQQEHHDAVDQQPPREERFPIIEPTFSRSRVEARRLEDKVAKVAAKKCSVEEVSTLHQELQDWLTHDESSDNQVSHLTTL